MFKNIKNILTFLILFSGILLAGFSGNSEKISLSLLKQIRKSNPGELITAWIYFKDKGFDLNQKIESIHLSYNPRTLQRRIRHQSLYPLADEYDVPVEQQYVDTVSQYVDRIRHKSRWLNAVSVEATGRELRRIAELVSVKKIERVRSFVYRDPKEIPRQLDGVSIQKPGDHTWDYGPSYSQVQQMNVPELHDMGYTGAGVLVCMLDTGFNNLPHESLDHLNLVATWDFVNDDPDVSDQPGQMSIGNHGTKTLSTIAGFHPGELIGPAFGADFILGKTENTEWERHIEEDHWVAGAEWADSMGADIISSSLGYRYEFTHGETDYTWEDMDGQTTIVTRGANIAASRGILIVNSAGNEDAIEPPQNTLIGPADSAQVLAAGAINPSGNRVSFSSVGPTADGRIKPDVMAQGSNVYTADVDARDVYDYVAGTSFSCPLTAGVAALLLEINPLWTNRDIMEAIKMTASNSNDPDNRMGWGIVNAPMAAVYSLKEVYPPDNFGVIRTENYYGFFIQYVDKLTWASNPLNKTSIQYYRIYARPQDARNEEFDLIVQLDSNMFIFERRGLLEGETFLYKITAVSESGEESNPVFARQ